MTKGGRLLAALGAKAGFRNARWALASQVVTSAGNLVATLVIVRALGVAEFGRYTICFLLMMIVRTFLNAMVLSPMSTIAPKLRPSSAPAYRGFLLTNAIIFAFGSSLILTAGSIPLGALLGAPWLPALALALAAANLLGNATDFLRRYHFVYESPARAFAIDAVRHGVNITLLFGFTIAGAGMLDLENALWILTTGSFASMFVGLVGLGTVAHRTNFSRIIWPRHWNFIRNLAPGTTVDILQNSGLLLVAGALLGEGPLGRVRAMQSLANAINLPFNALQEIAPSMASRAFKSGGLAAMNRVFGRMILWSSLFILGVSAAVIGLSEPLIEGVFGLSAEENLGLLLMALALNGLVLFRLPVILSLQSMERLSPLWKSGVVGLVAAYLALYAFRAEGAEAVPYARMVAFFLSLGVLVWALRRWSRAEALKRQYS